MFDKELLYKVFITQEEIENRGILSKLILSRINHGKFLIYKNTTVAKNKAGKIIIDYPLRPYTGYNTSISDMIDHSLSDLCIQYDKHRYDKL